MTYQTQSTATNKISFDKQSNHDKIQVMDIKEIFLDLGIDFDEAEYEVVNGIPVPYDLIPIELQLVGTDSNAFSIMGRATDIIKRNSSREYADVYRKLAMAGDYNNLLSVTSVWCDVS